MACRGTPIARAIYSVHLMMRYVTPTKFSAQHSSSAVNFAAPLKLTRIQQPHSWAKGKKKTPTVLI